MTYDAVKGTISGYPVAAGVYFIPLLAPVTTVVNSNAVTARHKNLGHVAVKPTVSKGQPLPSQAISVNSVSAAISTMLTFRVTAPDLSLPRLLSQMSMTAVLSRKRRCLGLASIMWLSPPTDQSIAVLDFYVFG